MLSVTWVIAILDECIVLVHTLCQSGAISVAELDRGAVGREDGLLSPDVSVVDDVGNWRDQRTITEVLVFLCAM